MSDLHPGDKYISEHIFPGKTAGQLGPVEIQALLHERCACKEPIGIGASSQLLGRTQEENLHFCVKCWRRFDTNAKPFLTFVPRDDTERWQVEAAIAALDGITREVCSCHSRKYDTAKLYKINEIVRCQLCGRIAGKFQVTN